MVFQLAQWKAILFILEFAKRYGCNLYLPRLAGHGIDDDDSFSDLRPEDLIASAKEAIAIGQLLGEKLILMSCSTGSTLSIYLSAENPEIVDAQFMFAPNIALHDPSAKLMTGPWGAAACRTSSWYSSAHSLLQRSRDRKLLGQLLIILMV